MDSIDILGKAPKRISDPLPCGVHVPFVWKLMLLATSFVASMAMAIPTMSAYYCIFVVILDYFICVLELF
jgi:hypothetical protein